MRNTLAAIFCVVLIGTPTLALEIGDKAPVFTLPAVDGSSVSLSDFEGKVVVLEWFNSGCPYVQKHYKPGFMQKLQAKYAKKGVVWLAINSTHSGHADYLGVEGTEKFIAENKVTAATFLLDEDGVVGKQYHARTTPHMYIIGTDGTLLYRGAIDDDTSAFADPKKSKNYVKKALRAILKGEPVKKSDTKPYGCSIKYKS